jgi:FtsP/CotA-like multicopper oxidase with cupredoxin domain
MDGVPGFNGFDGIQPGETFTYSFPVRQSGTYWYHSRSGLQEQAGVYGPIVIEPPGRDAVAADCDYVVMLSDFTPEPPERILNNLKVDSGYYNFSQLTLGDFFRDAREMGLGAAIRDRLAWGKMRMSPTDLSDVSGYTFLVNGKGPAANETFLYKPGERVRLRFINGSAMSYFDVRIPGLRMAVVQADGRNVIPVPIGEFRIAVAETYDVIVLPRQEGPYTIFAEPIDRTSYARATLATREGEQGGIPKRRPRTLLTMADMGMAMPGMDHGSMQGMAGGDTGDMSGMDHGAMDMDKSGDTSGRPRGWADSGAPPGTKVLSYADLKSLTLNDDLREPERTIEVRLTGNMERFIWSINGKKEGEAQPIELKYGARVRLKFVNETMMAHPMHLHGMFVELENGQTDRKPEKHVVNVPPGQSYSVLITADEPGEWAFYCHLLFHRASGMMTKVIVARLQTAQVAP